MISLTFTELRTRFADYVELTKLRLVSLVMLSAAVGFFLGSHGPFNFSLFANCLIGTSFVAAGSMALNQWWERREDALMMRTLARPLPAAKLSAAQAFFFGLLLSFAGLVILFFETNIETTVTAAVTLVTYVWFYTPLKKKTTLCTIVGAVPGALPPIIGWAAAGKVTLEAWLLFAIIFLWQMPHFLAIAWLYRKDYANAGFKMLSVEDPSGTQVSRQILLYSLALLPVSLLPTVLGFLGPFYFVGALLFGLGLIAISWESLKNLDAKAGLLFRASILYLSGILILMVLDKV